MSLSVGQYFVSHDLLGIVHAARNLVAKVKVCYDVLLLFL